MVFTDICKLIEKIDDEVRVIHPLIRNVLWHMEGITEVEYTHGPNERGADLIKLKLTA
jgi:hypothetical protein